MIRQFREFVLDLKMKFPLEKNELGFYHPTYTEDGHYLRCPNCGGSSWAIKSYQHLECTHCYRSYCNLGILGLQEL
jgi:hypothetical protein